MRAAGLSLADGVLALEACEHHLVSAAAHALLFALYLSGERPGTRAAPGPAWVARAARCCFGFMAGYITVLQVLEDALPLDAPQQPLAQVRRY